MTQVQFCGSENILNYKCSLYISIICYFFQAVGRVDGKEIEEALGGGQVIKNFICHVR